jgi:mono/diheme cytochrome c family protein
MTGAFGKMALPAAALLFAATALSAGAGQAAPTQTLPPAAATTPGEHLFRTKCAICHAARGMGTIMIAKRLGPDHGELAKRSDLDPGYITAVVRGGLMSMPPFTRVDITDAELKQVATWLTGNNPPAAAQ